MTFILCAFALACLFPGSAWAHPVGLSRLQVVMKPEGTQVVLSLNFQDFADVEPAGVGAPSGPDVVRWAEGKALEWVELRVDGAALRPTNVVGRAGEDGAIVLSVEGPAVSAGAESLDVRSRLLADLSADHRQLLSVEDARGPGRGRVLAEVALDRRQPSWSVDLPGGRAGEGIGARVGPVSCFRVGAAGVFIGFAPLLFLAALLLGCERMAAAGQLAALFGVACSIGLVLGALDVVRLPGRVVGSAVAASVIYMAAENLIARDRVPGLGGRMLLSLGFGLIHGLGLSHGYASVLAESGPSPAELGRAGALAWFTAGAAAALACGAGVMMLGLALLWRKAWFRKGFVPALSAVLLLAGGWELLWVLRVGL